MNIVVDEPWQNFEQTRAHPQRADYMWFRSKVALEGVCITTTVSLTDYLLRPVNVLEFGPGQIHESE